MAEKTNFLVDGLHSDNEPSMQPDNTYREAWNGNLISFGNNRFSFESVKGNKVSFTIPDHYNQKPYQVIGWTSFIDELIVLIGNDQSVSFKPGEIGKVVFDNQGTGTYTPLYYHQKLGFSKNYPISNDDGIVGKPENANIRRVVWTDNHLPLRTINVFDSKFNTHVPSGALVIGTKYMVLTTDAVSYITHNGFDWAPGRSGDGVSQNIFVATGITYIPTGTNYKVIQYVAIESLDVTSVFAPGSILYKGWVIGGSLKSGTYQYAYQLETLDGERTNWSYLSSPMYAVDSTVPTDDTKSYAKFLGIPISSNTGKGIKLTIDNIDVATYKKIRVAFIRSTAIGVYTNPEVFFYDNVINSSIDFIHYGNEVALEIIDLNTLTTITSILDLVKTITSTKNILFAANVGLANDSKFDLSPSVQVKTIEYLLPSDMQGMKVTGEGSINSDAIFGHYQQHDASSGVSTILPYQWYESTGIDATTNYVQYNGLKYYIGSPNGIYFKGIPTIQNVTQAGSARTIAVIRIQKYTSPTIANAGNYKNIRIENDFVDFKSPLISHYLKSYWRKEIYRYGIFVHGTKGQQNFVLFLADKFIPEQYRSAADTEIIDVAGTTALIGFEMRLCESDANASYGGAFGPSATLRSIGVSFSNIDFNLIATAYGCSIGDLDQFIKGFSIVRVERDEQIISQGALWAVMNDGAVNNYAMATNNIGTDKYQVGGIPYGRRKNYYLYHSPDALSQMPDFNGNSRLSIQSGDLLEVTDYYSGVHGNDAGQGMVSGFNFYEKNYIPVADIGGPVYGKGSVAYIATSNSFNLGRANVQAMPGTGETMNNNGTCGVGSSIDPGAERKAQGTEGVLVFASADEATYPLGLGKFDQFSIHKTIVNWIRPKNANNLYGGNSDSVKSTHKYIFCGHYQALDSDFMTYMTGTSDATPSAPGQIKNAGIVNNVEVFGGDAYVCMFGFERMIRDHSGGAPITMSLAQVIPLETNINENWRGYIAGAFRDDRGTLNYNRAYLSPTVLGGLQYDSGGTDFGYKESFDFKNAFAGIEKEYFFAARPLGFYGSKRDEQLIIRSLEKINGEILDNWRVFLVNNQKRVDSQFGAINNIRAKGSRLFYWQMKGIGYLPISERQMQNAALGNAVQMGIGGIMERFDAIDYYHGNQHQMGLMENDDSFLWMDFRRRKTLRIGFNGGEVVLSEIKGLDSFFQTLFDNVETETGTTIFNSENPLTGNGIISYYDSRFNLGLMVFKYSKTDISNNQIVEQDFAIGFNKNLDKYIGFFNLAPNQIISHNGNLLMTRQVRPNINSNTQYNLGDELSDLVDYNNYVCILPYFIAAVGPGSDPSTDSTHWQLASKPNEVYVNWRNDICKFFGIVHPWSITMVLKDQNMEGIVIDNLEAGGNDTAFSDVFIDNGSDNAADVNITSSNRYYKYFNGSWWFSLPLKDKTTRLTDHYVRIKLQVKNYSGNAITTSINKGKRVFYVKQFFRSKK